MHTAGLILGVAPQLTPPPNFRQDARRMTQPDLCKHAIQSEWHRKSVFHTQGGTIPSRSLLCLLVWTMLAIGSSAPALANNARQTPVVKAIQKAKPAVVNIQGNKVVADNSNSDSKVQTVNGMGTGVIIDPRGYIVTCYHVVQDVAKIEVTLADGSETRARLLNYDSATDLALIKIDMKKTSLRSTSAGVTIYWRESR